MSDQSDQTATSGSGRPKFRRLSADALKAVLDDHQKWLETAGEEGKRADLSAANLQGMSLWSANLEEADLSDSNLQGTNMDHAKLQRAELRGADLQGASLWSANLLGADLTGADLRRAKLDHAVLSQAKLDRAELRGATIWDAHLDGADLSQATGLTQAQLDPACGDEKTRLPDNLKVKPCP